MSTKGDYREQSKDSNSEEDVSEVHSANSWETADLGDKQRNEKFLRLMGASKKEHHGKFVIGDKNPAQKRERREDQHLAEELEEQYDHSLEYRLAAGKKGHLGLGYRPESTEQKEEQEPNEEEGGAEAKGEEGEEKEAEKQGEEKEAEEQEGEEKEAEEQEGEEKETEEQEGEDCACEESNKAVEDNDKDDSNTENEKKRKSIDNDSKSGVKKMKFMKSSS